MICLGALEPNSIEEAMESTRLRFAAVGDLGVQLNHDKDCARSRHMQMHSLGESEKCIRL